MPQAQFRPMVQAKAMVLKEPRVQKRAKNMHGFDGNIGKYVSLTYLEAEKEAFLNSPLLLEPT